jgi:hypothetical protein
MLEHRDKYIKVHGIKVVEAFEKWFTTQPAKYYNLMENPIVVFDHFYHYFKKHTKKHVEEKRENSAAEDYLDYLHSRW